MLPEEYKSFKTKMEKKDRKNFYLAKPSKGKGGDGIFFVKKLSDLSKEQMRLNDYVAQEYIANPLLIDKKKFDFRLYLMIKGVDTMHGYVAFEGMARFWTEDYTKPKINIQNKNEKNEDKEVDVNDQLYGHLTNFSLNKKSDKYETNNDFETNENSGSKRLLSTIFRQLENDGIDVDEIKDDIKDICTKVVLALQPFLVNSFHTDMGVGSEANQNWFHIFGIDILLDENYKSWVMEINCFPSLSYFYEREEIDKETGVEKTTKIVSDLDKYLKTNILRDAITIVRNDKVPKNSLFEQVFPPVDYPQDYKEFTIFNDIRVLFELLAGFRKPDMLTLSQFQKIAYFPGMKTDKLSKPEYGMMFAQYAKRGNKSLMSLDNFTVAIENLAKEFNLNDGDNPRPLVTKLINHIKTKPMY